MRRKKVEHAMRPVSGTVHSVDRKTADRSGTIRVGSLDAAECLNSVVRRRYLPGCFNGVHRPGSSLVKLFRGAFEEFSVRF